MEKVDDVINKRAEKSFNWLKNKYSLGLVLVLALALIIRVYYFFITKDQALWWDALAYGSIAKTHFLSGEWSTVATSVVYEMILRPPLLPILWSFLMDIGFAEPMSKFVLEIIPSFLSVFVVYLIGKEIYGKKTALLAAFILGVSWMHIFYSTRILTNIPALFFSLISIYFMFKGIDREKIKQKYFALSIFFLSLAILMRYPYGLLGVTYAVFLIIVQKFRFLKQKSFWIGGVLGAIPLILFFGINIIRKGSLFPALEIYSYTASGLTSYAFYTFGFLSHIMRGPFYFLFLFGLIVMVAQLVLGFDIITKSKKLRFNLFIILLLVITFAFFIFWLKNVEDRYLFIGYPSLIFIMSIGIITAVDFVKKYSKVVAIIGVVAILIWGSYAQIKFGDDLIESRKTSFTQMKEAFTWLDENAPPGSIVLGHGTEYYTIYYTDLVPQFWPKDKPGTYERYAGDNLPDFWPATNGIEGYEVTADYIIVNAFHRQDAYVDEYLQTIQYKLTPVFASFFDQEQQQPAVVIYKYNKDQEATSDADDTEGPQLSPSGQF